MSILHLKKICSSVSGHLGCCLPIKPMCACSPAKAVVTQSGCVIFCIPLKSFDPCSGMRWSYWKQSDPFEADFSAHYRLGYWFSVSGDFGPRWYLVKSGDILVVTTWGRWGWFLLRRGRGCCSVSYRVQGSLLPPTETGPAWNVHGVEAETPWSRANSAPLSRHDPT